MSDIAIRCENLSKQYRIGRRERYKTLRDTLADTMSAPFRRLRSAFNGSDRTEDEDSRIWALKDVSFDVSRGDVVGIIGRNGAGKSTLLKILSRITEPTAGCAQIYGRVGSLLEVGTGFHPELTGRENIYLNGAILGMKRDEIRRKFDEIVAFAEVEKFIDTPVKHFSSGMHVRLAFAVAAHLEPEILLVDEVLAVGDAEFQKKCLEKMQSIHHGGRTIMFVSHNMSAMRNICQRGFILEHGRFLEYGEINSIVDKYLSRSVQKNLRQERVETESFLIEHVQIYSPSSPVIKTLDPVEIRIQFAVKTDIFDPGLYVGILSLENQRLAGLDFKDFMTAPAVLAGGSVTLGFSIQSFPLLPGRYQVELHLKDMAKHKIEIVPQTFSFEVVETPIHGGRKIDSWYGCIALDAKAVASTTPLEGRPVLNYDQ